MPPGQDPQIVEEAKYRPGKCLASGDTEGPFIDCGRWTREHDPYLQLSVRWVEETARDLLGMLPAEDAKELEEHAGALEALARQQAQRLDLVKDFESVLSSLDRERVVA